jgi:outer membrane protein assembly factor BamB
MSTYRFKVVLILMFLIVGCGNRLKMPGFLAEPSTYQYLFFTSHFSYNRNPVSNEELKPPLIKDWEETYKSHSNNGFTSVSNLIFLGMQNGDIAAINIENGNLEGQKNLGDACAVPPTVYQNILYQTFETGKHGIIAYDISEGTAVWSLDGQLSRSAPVVVNETVIFQSLNGDIICVNRLNGQEQWRQSLRKKIRNSAAYKDNFLITVTLDGTLYEFDSRSGKIIWNLNLNTPVFADPVIEGETVYITSHKGILFAIDLKRGQELSTKEFGTELYNSPTIDQNNIYIASSDGILYSIDKKSFENRWIFSGEGAIVDFAVVTPSYVYITTMAKKFYILKKNNGKMIQEIELEGRASSAPMINQSKLIIACEERQVVAYAEEN